MECVTFSSGTASQGGLAVKGCLQRHNSTELSCVAIDTSPTQLNSTSSCRRVHSVNNCHLSMNVVTQLTQFVGRDFINKNTCTLFNWVSSVELNCVAINTRLGSKCRPRPEIFETICCRVTLCVARLYCRAVSGCQNSASRRESECRRASVKMSEDIVRLFIFCQFRHSGFPHETICRNPDGVPLTTYGVEYKLGMKKPRFSTNTSRYLGNDT